MTEEIKHINKKNQEYIAEGNRMTEENCNFQQSYNIFGLDDKPCCYLYHKYCEEIDSCYFKKYKRLEQENKQMKSVLKEINLTLLGVRGLSINCDKQIIKVKAIINEVLND